MMKLGALIFVFVQLCFQFSATHWQSNEIGEEYPYYVITTNNNCEAGLGVGFVWGFDPQLNVTPIHVFNFTYHVKDPSLCELYALALGPGVFVSQNGVVYTATSSLTAFDSNSFLRIDMRNKLVTQPSFIREKIFSIHHDLRRNVLLVVLHYATTQILQEFDVDTLRPGRVLGAWNLNAPQLNDAFYDSATQFLTQVVEHNFVHNYWMILDCSSAKGNASLKSLVPFKSDTQPLTLTYDQGSAELLAIYQPPNFGNGSIPVQVFFVDPKTGKWPIHGIFNQLLEKGSGVSMQAPLNHQTNLVFVVLSPESSSSKTSRQLMRKTTADCVWFLLRFSDGIRMAESDIDCQFGEDAVWFSMS